MEQKPPTSKQADQPVDPFMMASAINSFVVERNPIKVLVGDIAHTIKVVANLGKTRKLAQRRIDQLQSQMEKVEQNIAHVHPKAIGNRLDKMR